MTNLSHDFITVDMRGLKAALVERARSERVTVSAVVRHAVARKRGADVSNLRSIPTSTDPRSTKISIRLTASEAQRLKTQARAHKASIGALLTGLAAGTPALASGANRADLLAALVRSSAELSSLNRSIHHLVMLLREGSVQAAREYWVTFDTLAGEVEATCTWHPQPWRNCGLVVRFQCRAFRHLIGGDQDASAFLDRRRPRPMG